MVSPSNFKIVLALSLLFGSTYGFAKIVTKTAIVASVPSLEKPDIAAAVRSLQILEPKASQGDKISTDAYIRLVTANTEEKTSVVATLSEGSTSLAQARQSVEEATQMAPVVLFPIGAAPGFMKLLCLSMQENPDTVFIATAGNSAQRLSDTDWDECFADNILFVAPLDSNGRTLHRWSNFGGPIRIAAPGLNTQGASPMGGALSCVTRKIARLMDLYPGARGAELVQVLLQEAVFLEGLEGQVNDSLALKDC